MIDLAGWMIVATIVTFTVGAAFALAWSIATGQWKDLGKAARSVLDTDDGEPQGSDVPWANGGTGHSATSGLSPHP